MNYDLHAMIAQLSTEMLPLPTGIQSRLTRLPDVKAILFDIYGTLLISAAGDITLQTHIKSDEIFREVLLRNGKWNVDDSAVTADLLQHKIQEHQSRARREGISCPEVDIVVVWQDVLQELGMSQASASVIAAEYEMRVNPVWPMPGMPRCLETLKERGLPLGIVSNAQAVTLDLFPGLLNSSLDDLGFDADLSFFSFRFRESKPGQRMFRAAAKALAERGLTPRDAVFVGNDMLNDVWAAAQMGFRTVLFAGDRRSLRLRESDSRVQGCQPDAVVTELSMLANMLT